MTKPTVLFLVAALVYANARHIHPYRETRADTYVEEIWMNHAKGEKSAPVKEDYVNVEVPEEIQVNIKPNRFVPLNNALFFMGHQPCAEEGFKRDYMGICREVWDLPPLSLLRNLYNE